MSKFLVFSSLRSRDIVESLNKLIVGGQEESVLPQPTAEAGPLRPEGSNGQVRARIVLVGEAVDVPGEPCRLHTVVHQDDFSS